LRHRLLLLLIELLFLDRLLLQTLGLLEYRRQMLLLLLLLEAHLILILNDISSILRLHEDREDVALNGMEPLTC